MNRDAAPFLVAVFLAAILFAGGAWYLRGASGTEGVFGGPAADVVNTELLAPVVQAATAPAGEGSAMAMGAERGIGNISADGAATLRDPGRPMGILESRGEPISYMVKRGDTLSRIALEFGISVQTITAANPTVRAASLRAGQELTILPTSGVTYETRGGEDLAAIAELFEVSSERIREANRSTDFSALAAGTVIVIPGENLRVSAARGSSLPAYPGYFAMPTTGYNWGKRHEQNAVDIANVCGTPVTAAAEGLVVEALGEGWNSGYGHMVTIEHPNETKTRYAHLEGVLVSIGDYVRQGDAVGTIGNTGNVHGPTGCHLHFEVDGAQNPFVK